MSARTQMQELFRPPGAEWNRLSPSYLTLKLISIAIWLSLIHI